MKAKGLLTFGALGALAAAFLWHLRQPSSPPSSDASSPDLDRVNEPKTSATPQRLAAHKAAAPIMTEAARSVLGRDPNADELAYLLAVAFLESSYGKGWKGAMVGSNNWGAVQCGKASQNAPGCILYQDSYSDGTPYSVSFRSYPSAVDGAADVAKHVLVHRPRTAEALSRKGATAFDASYAMRREKYYGGFCPKASNRFGAEAAKVSLGSPDRDEGTRACEAEAVSLHANRAQGLMLEIAQALGTTAMPLGAFETARARYASGQQAVSGLLENAGGDVLSVFDEPCGREVICYECF